MLDPKLIRETPDAVRAAIAKKHLDVDLDAVLAIDVSWRAQLQEVEALRSRQKAANTAMAALPKGSPEFQAKVAEMKAVSADVKTRELQLKETEEKFRTAMLSIPNLPQFAGLDLFTQAALTDATDPSRAILTEGLQLHIGY